MVPVARDHLAEGLLAALARLLREVVRGVPRRYLVPDEHSHFVRGFEVFRRANLDVAAQEVQAHALALQHLLAHVLLRRRRVDRIGVEVLVERRAHVERLAVQIQLPIARLERAEAEAGRVNILITPLPESDLDGVQRGLRKAPKLRRIYFPLKHAARLWKLTLPRAELDLAMRVAHDDFGRVRLSEPTSAQPHSHAETTVRARRHVYLFDVNARLYFNPHGLPQAAGLRVPVLLAVRYLVVEHFGEARAAFVAHWRVCDAHGEFVRAQLQGVRHVERERRVTALVRADGLTVDEDLREVVARAEAQERPPPARYVWPVERRPIPRDAHVVAQVFKLRVPRKPDAHVAPATRRAEVGHFQRAVSVRDELPAAFELDRLRADA